MKLGSTQINKVYLGATEAKKIYLGTNLILDTGTNDTVVTIDTTSTSATWTPQSIINSGATLTWEVTGGVTIAPQVIDKPILNLSSNTGTANITITSSTGFVGFTEIQLDQLLITSTDITEAVDLVKIDYWENPIGTIDLTQNLDLESIWLEDTGLTAFDLSLNTLAKYVYLDVNNLLNTAALDKIVNDLYANGVTGGTLLLADNTGLPLTSASDTAYDWLDANGWSIDVAKSTPVDTEDPVIGTMAYANESDTTVELSMSVASTDNVAVVEHWIYKDYVFEKIITGATFSNHEITGLTANTNYDFNCVAYDAAGNFSLTSNTVNFTTDTTPASTDDLRPVLSNFRIEDANKDRVYFDSSEIITASTGINGYTGFLIEDSVINQITINTDSLINHYFTVTADYNFYSNDLIRYEGGSDIADSESNGVYEFTLQRIVNNITEPSASTLRYAASSTQGSGNGLSEANAWSYSTAGTSATAGMTVMMLAGTTSGTMTISNDGTLANPIKFIGYNNAAKDVDRTKTTGMTFDATIMPLFLNGSASDAINMDQRDYIFFENIQIDGYSDECINAGHLFNSVIRNVYMKNAFVGINPWGVANNNIRIIDSYVQDVSGIGIYPNNEHHLIDNCYACSTYNVGMDYYFGLGGGFNGVSSAIINCYAERFITDSHTGHGMIFKADEHLAGYNCDYNLMEDNTIVNIAQGYTFQHVTARYNVVRNCRAEKTSGANASNLITIRDDANYNIVENCYADDIHVGVLFVMNGNENEGIQAGGHHNKIINTVFNDCNDGIQIHNGWNGTALESTYNEFLNCTWYNCGELITNSSVAFGSTNEFINNIIELVPSYDTSPSFSYSDFYVAFPTPLGDGNISEKPYFTDAPNGDFSLSSETRDIVYEGGTDVEVYYDKDGRETITPISMGAYYKNTSDIFPTVYVALSGDDSDGLTPSTAWNNLTSVENDSSNWLSGEVVSFNGGDEFYGNLLLNNVNGASGNEITLTSYGTGKAIITGGEAITGWSNTSGNIWEADVTGKTIYQVIKNNQALRLASYPKIITDYSTVNNYYQITSATSESQFISTDLIGLADFTGGTIGCFRLEYSIRSATVQSFNNTTGEVVLDTAIANLNAGDDFFVTNSYNLLDAENEWYYDSSVNKLYVYSLSSPTDIHATTTNGNGISVINSDYLDVTNLQIKYYTANGIDYDLSDNNLIDSNDIYYCQNEGVRTDHGTLSTITNNYIKGTVSIAINSRTTYSNVTENELFEIGMIKDITDIVRGGVFQGIELASSNSNATNNELEKIGYIGIRIFGEDCVVNENFIQDYCLAKHDGGGIYTWNSNYTENAGNNLLIDKNIILNEKISESTAWSDYPIYLDDFSHDITVTNNSTSKGISSLFLHNAKDISCVGNNFYLSTSRGVLISEDNIGGGNDSVINNDLSYNNTIINSNITASLNPKSSFVAPFSFGASDYNQWYNLSAIAERIVRFEVDGTIEQLTLAQWQSLYSQDLNSGSSADVGTITDTDFHYNATSEAVNIDLAGSWQELDGTAQSGTITLQPYTSIILIQL